MARIAQFRLAVDEFPFGRLSDAHPSSTVELDRVVPIDGAIVPYFWVRGVDPEVVVAALEEQAAVRAVRLVDEVSRLLSPAQRDSATITRRIRPYSSTR